MTYNTDERLKGYLDTNQLERERLCLAVLGADRRYSDVRPRHPRGGPDGGRDIEATYQKQQHVFGAVGFINQANDSAEHKRKSISKFQEDLKEALRQVPIPAGFVFFTNVNLTAGDKEALVGSAKKQGLQHAEIFDRERIRIVLDSPDGLSIRYQYLGLPLSDAEQAAFFARWGDDIQSLLAAGFGAIEKSLNRIQFLQEANLPLSTLWVSLQLDREYTGAEIGHFRAFAHVRYVAHVEHVISILFGSADNAKRNDAKVETDLIGTRSGISEGMAGAQWELSIREEERKDVAYLDLFKRTRSWGSIGRDRVKFIGCNYEKGQYYRFETGPRPIDLNGSHFMFFTNRSLAEKISTIRIFANDYKLAEFSEGQFSFATSNQRAVVPMLFTAQELEDEWVLLTPPIASAFRLDFSEHTPRRFYSAVEISADEANSGRA
jgi:hypothetical protein